jgi:hypothetical protein
MANFCGKCGTPLPIDSEADACWRHGGPPLTAGAQIRCPFCKEPIYAEAKKCRFCGEAMIVPDVYVPQILGRDQSVSGSELNPAAAYRAVQRKSRGGVSAWMQSHPLLTLGIVFFGLLFGAIVRLESLSESPSTSPTVSGDSVAKTKPEVAIRQATQELPEFSKMTVAQHLTEAKRLINPTAEEHDLQEADSHLKEVLKRSPGNGEARRLYDLAMARTKQIAVEMEKNWAVQAAAHPQKDLAQIKCEEAVNASLKAPSTASFAPYSSTNILDLGKWMYRVDSYVDAENSFGAHMRSPYSCTVQCVAVDACAVKDLMLTQ